MSETWVCTSSDHHRRVAVRCVGVLTAFEVRQFAAKKLGVEPGSVDAKLTADGVPFGTPVIEVRWTGDDYAHGGTTRCRRLQERPLGTAEWVDA